MVAWETEYWLVRFVFQRGLALLYCVAFLVAARQFRPLAGEDGLLPIEEYINQASFRDHPSLFYFLPSDRVIGIAAWSGVALSIVALVGGPYWVGDPYAIPLSMALWTVLWLLYQSFVNAGRLFYGYGWETMLLETGFLAIFLGAGSSGPPVIVLWLLNWVLFRNMFGAGLIKLRGDECWRELTCLESHYETQPLPNPTSWYVHHLPARFHRLEALGNFVVEIAVPFLYFAPHPIADVAGIATISFQAWLMLTGNFSWLNALTIVQAITTFSDGVLAVIVPFAPATSSAPPRWQVVLAVLVAVLVICLSVNPVRNMLSERQIMNTSFDPLHLVNTYGAFGSITKRRTQLVIEATTETDPTPDDWHEYEWYGQPSDPGRRPSQVAPYHLRLDWQLWFAGMRPRPGSRQRWLRRLLDRLLEPDDDVRALLRSTPFEQAPPEQIRIVRYRYRFSTPEERAVTGTWYVRSKLGLYLGPISRPAEAPATDARAEGPDR